MMRCSSPSTNSPSALTIISRSPSPSSAIPISAFSSITLACKACGDVEPTPFIDTSKSQAQAPIIQENLSEEDAFQQDLKDLLIRTTQRIADKALWGWNDKGAQWASDDLNDLGDMIVSSVGNKSVFDFWDLKGK